MLLRARVIAEVETRELSLFAKRRIDAALKTLEQELGQLDVGDLTPPQLAQVVYVPGDDARYIVIGDWADGTVDVVREFGSFPADCLVGWRPGQSIEAYATELAAEPVPEPTDEHRRTPRSLLTTASTSR